MFFFFASNVNERREMSVLTSVYLLRERGVSFVLKMSNTICILMDRCINGGAVDFVR